MLEWVRILVGRLAVAEVAAGRRSCHALGVFDSCLRTLSDREPVALTGILLLREPLALEIALRIVIVFVLERTGSECAESASESALLVITRIPGRKPSTGTWVPRENVTVSVLLNETKRRRKGDKGETYHHDSCCFSIHAGRGTEPPP